MSFWRSKITEELVKRTTDGLTKSYSIPSVVNGRFEIKSNNAGISDGIIKSIWSQRSPEIGKKRQFAKIFGMSSGTAIGSSMPLLMEAAESLSIFKNGREIVISKVKNCKGDDTELLEFFDNGHIEKTINLSDLDLHGIVYYDQEFGGLVMNPSGSKVAYIAEIKKEKNTPFFPASKIQTQQTKKDDNHTQYGKEFAYHEEWGEQLVGKSKSIIVVVDLENYTVDTFDDLVPETVCPGQLEWISDDTLVGIGLISTPYRLGAIYCSNRPAGIFQLDLCCKAFQWIREPTNITCRHPKVNPSLKKLVYFEADLHQDLYPGPHERCFRLMSYDLQSKETQVILDFINNPTFKGFHMMGPAPLKNCFANDEIFVWNLIDEANNYPIIINTKTNEFKINSKNINVLDVFQDSILGVRSDLLTPQVLVSGKINLTTLSMENLVDLTSPMKTELNEDIIIQELTHIPPSDRGYGINFGSIYVGPKTKSAPLIVFPHGGPHSVIPNAFSNDIVFFLQQGFACLLINYRGSISYGQTSIDSLLGKVGDQDVKDCFQAYQECLQRFPNLDATKSVLFGGSHGGFLVTHLVGQYPDQFKACVPRNPVINIASMATVSDIGDWTFNEAGITFQYKSPDGNQMEQMYQKSPIQYVKDVQAPVYLMIGKDDLRVPPSQGVEYYHNMKAHSKLVDMNWYEDNHPLGKVNNHCNVFINTVLFFKIILGME